jgi:hypothetical protein
MAAPMKGLENGAAEDAGGEVAQGEGEDESPDGHDEGVFQLRQQELGVRLHAGVEHDEEDSEVCQELDTVRRADEAEKGGAQEESRQELAEEEGLAEAAEDIAHHQGRNENEHEVNDQRRRDHRFHSVTPSPVRPARAEDLRLQIRSLSNIYI